MAAGRDFIMNNFKREAILQQNAYSCTEIVLQNGTPYVRKTINAVGLPYTELKKLSHPVLPHIFYAMEVEGRTLVIEEYVSGQTLKDCLEQGISFSAEQQKSIALQLCRALELLHGKGILHRDIKPSNIIVMHDLQQVKLIDFGIGRSFANDNTQELQDTCIMGTPGYAPPEQYGFSTTDQRSDIYALGKTLLELKNEASDSEFIEVLKRCTAFDPAKRYQNIGEVLKDLTAAPKQTQLKAFAFCLAAALLAASLYFFYAKAPGVSVTKPAALKPPAPPAASQPQSFNLVKMKQLGYEWWFDKSTLQTVDAKENIYKFKGINNKGPVITVENTSDYPAVNTVLKLELYTFGMKAQNFEHQTDPTHKERVEFSLLDRLGVARRVRITLDGEIPPHSRYTFRALEGIKDFYMYYKGDHGTILGEIKSKSMLPKNVGYTFNLK